MPVLNYWNSKVWVPVASLHPDHPALKKIGGKMTGTLNVEGKLLTTGFIQAGYITGHIDVHSPFNMNISLMGRDVVFGESELDNIADPFYEDDAATNKYLSDRSLVTLNVVPLTLEPSWTNHDPSFGTIQILSAGDGMVSMNGVVRSIAPIEPGITSEPITIIPEYLRPSGRKVFPIAGHSLIRVDVFPTGEVRIIDAPQAMQDDEYIVALNDICYYLG